MIKPIRENNRPPTVEEIMKEALRDYRVPEVLLKKEPTTAEMIWFILGKTP